jgi:EpsI family protein
MLALAPGVEAAKFAPDPMLPEDYVYVVGKGALLSAYVAYYPEQRMGAKAPHPPTLCYATQGWTTGPVQAWNVRVGTAEAVVRALEVRYGDHRRLVVYWEHQLGAIPVARDSSTWLHEPLDRLRAGRSDLAWVRLEFLPDESGFRRESVDPIVANVCRAVASAMGAGLP